MNITNLNKMMNDSIKSRVGRFIVNELGINLCSVKEIFVSKQKDGQIKEIRIVFIPAITSENEKIIHDWQAKNPLGKKMDCHRDTGISRPTIDKYWNFAEQGDSEMQKLTPEECMRNGTTWFTEKR